MAVQGFGNAGQHAALLGEEILKLKLVAASDSRGGVYNPNGISAAELVDYKLKNGVLKSFPGAEEISNEDSAGTPRYGSFSGCARKCNTRGQRIKPAMQDLLRVGKRSHYPGCRRDTR